MCNADFKQRYSKQSHNLTISTKKVCKIIQNTEKKKLFFINIFFSYKNFAGKSFNVFGGIQ